jgi:hypothetical protein
MENAILHPDAPLSYYDNNDGFSVIDVTDPSNPGYCFLHSSQAWASASDYLGSYSTLPTGDRAKMSKEDLTASQCLERLAAKRQLTKEDLAEVWPKLFRTRKAKPDAPHSRNLVDEVSQLSVPTLITDSVPSLADLATPAVLQQYIDSLDSSSIDEQLLDLPHKHHLVLSALSSLDPFPELKLEILIHALIHQSDVKNCGVLSLRNHKSLSIAQIVAVLQKIASSGVRINTVDLSGNHNLDSSIISLASSVVGSTALTLVLLDTSVSDEQLLDLLKKNSEAFYSIVDIIHPLLLSGRPLELSSTAGFAFTRTVEWLQRSERTGFLPFFHPDRVLNTLLTTVVALAAPDFLSGSRIDGVLLQQIMENKMIGSTIISAGTPFYDDRAAVLSKTREEGRTRWNTRSITTVPARRGIAGWKLLLQFTPGMSMSEEDTTQLIKWDFVKVRDPAKGTEPGKEHAGSD